jgi:hypothetical protein
MKRWKCNLLASAIALFLIISAVVGLISYYFGVVVTTEGSTQGFDIGESRVSAFAKAEKMLGEGGIAAIHVDPNMNDDSKWSLVVNPEWWNNKITLTFEEDALVEIRRDRICCELP